MIPMPHRLVALVQQRDAVFHPRLALVWCVRDGQLVYDDAQPADLVAFAELSGALAGVSATICGQLVHGSIGSARESLRRTSAQFIVGGQEIEMRGTGDSYALPVDDTAPTP